MSISVRRAIVITGSLTLLWLVLTLWIAPWLVTEAYEGRCLPLLSRMLASKRDVVSLTHYLGKVRLLAIGGGVAILGGGLALTGILHDAGRGSPLARRVVLPASPTSLAGIRIWVSVVALVSLSLEDVASTALLPGFSRLPSGLTVMSLVRQAPGAEALLRSPLALSALKGVTMAALLSGLFGFKTRLSLALGLGGALLIGGVLRMYTHFFHTGLLPLYVLGVLTVSPCGDVWSVDAWFRRRAGKAVPPAEEPSMVYGWGRFTCWAVIALSYFAAGTSKLRHGGLDWWDGVNLKSKVLGDALQVHWVDLPFIHVIDRFPTAAFAVLGLATLVVELGMLAVPFSARARLLLPLGAIGLHVGIFVAQEIIFLDLLLMQLIFYNHRGFTLPLARSIGSRLSSLVPASVGGARSEARADEAGSAASAAAAAPSPRSPSLLVLLPVAYLVSIALATESYPITSWSMYSNRTRSTIVEYILFQGIDGAGRRVPVRFEETFGVLRFSRDYDIIQYAFQSEAQHELRRVLDVLASIENHGKPPDEQLTAFHFHLLSWDYEREPDHPDRGSRIKQFEHRVGESR